PHPDRSTRSPDPDEPQPVTPRSSGYDDDPHASTRYAGPRTSSSMGHWDTKPVNPPGGRSLIKSRTYGIFLRRCLATIELRGLIDRQARPDQVTVQVTDPRRGQRAKPVTQVLVVPPVGAQQRLHLIPTLITSRLRQRPAVRPDRRR